MQNDKILEEWNKQFSDVDKLKIADVKDLYKKIDGTDNPELKKSYYDKIILGTQHVVYNYLKGVGLHLLSSVEVGAEDIIASTYEAWIENVKNGKLKEAKSFSMVANGRSFSSAVEEKLEINDKFEVPNKISFYQDRKDFSETALSALRDEQLREAFVKYYRIEQTGDEKLLEEQDVLSDYDMSSNQKERILIMFSKIKKYLSSMIGTGKISDTNLKKYTKLIVNNAIAEDFTNEFDLVGDRGVTSEIIDDEMRKKITASFKTARLSNLEEFVIRNRFGFDDGEIKTYTKLSKDINCIPERVRQIESKSLLKLRRPYVTKNLRDYL